MSCMRRLANKGSPVTTAPSTRLCARVANAASMSRLVPAVTTSICRPRAKADACMFLDCASAVGLAGLTSAAKRMAPGSQLAYELKLLCGNLLVHGAYASYVAPGSSEAGDKANLDGIYGNLEDDRNGPSRGLGREGREHAPRRSDDRDRPVDELCR